MKRFAVFGLGSFGINVVRSLYKQGAEVIAIDIDEDAVQACSDISHHAVVADATDKSALEQLAINEVDVAVVSLGERMDRITLTSLHLKELGVPYVATKAISDNHETILKAIGVNEVIQPEKEAAIRLGTRLSLSDVIDVLPLVSDDFSVVSLHASEEITGKRIGDLESSAIQVVAIQSSDERQPKLIPSSDEVIESDSKLIILGSNKEINIFTKRYCSGN
ncbi:MAG: TrkA family potassium uptake protein [Acidobacteriota bacterium]|nr:TrkA family potassium uptake protein [Acidobacteriota bacterium]MDH3529601.1 TrkA family potassium uptake protein [Acidobacteriota bacterium]